jgi:hypothetical protein
VTKKHGLVNYDESRVRSWLKRMWGDGLVWIEQASGGTTGAPDVMAPMPGGLMLPVELKYWKRSGMHSIRCKVRPAQIQYHVKSALAGQKTAFIVGTESTLRNADMSLFMFAGKDCPREERAQIWRLWRPVADKQDIINNFLSKSFWE